MKILSVFLFITIFALSTFAQDKPELKESWYCKSLASEGKFILEDPNYRVWGCAPIYDDEGKVHVYFSRWKISGDWLKNSEIAHAVADHPEGPYKVLGTILKGRGTGYWDAHSIHNPSIYRVGKKYVLLYIGNDTTKVDEQYDRAQTAGSQRVGMAIADSPYGPWKRFDKPMIDVSPNPKDWDSYCTVNPAFVQKPDGGFLLYYRAWDRKNDDRRKTGVAYSDNLEGPYKKYEGNPVIDHKDYGGQTEDPYCFYYNNKYHCIIRDMGNYDWLSSLYLSSDDGYNWPGFERAHHKGDTYFDVPENARYERVQILFKDGKPEYQFNAIQKRLGENKVTCGAVLKINL